MSDPTATVVLVHGAWHGGWCWERIVDRLSAGGVRAVAVDLPGHGGDPGPMSDLHGDSARVRSVLDGIDMENEVVLLTPSLPVIRWGRMVGSPGSRSDLRTG